MYTFNSPGALAGDNNFASENTFTTNNAIVIDQIGLFDFNNDGLNQDHGFRIRDLTNSLDLFNGMFMAGSGTLINHFRFVDIADISVGSGIQISVMFDNQSVNNTDLMGFNLNGLAFDPLLTYNGSSFKNEATVADYPFSSSTSLLAGANLLINNAVPEPSIIALFAAGLFGIGFARRKVRS
jgi:hypothetical protein